MAYGTTQYVTVSRRALAEYGLQAYGKVSPQGQPVGLPAKGPRSL